MSEETQTQAEQELMQEACDIVNGAAMDREQAAGPDLATLNVMGNSNVASHSETPF